MQSSASRFREGRLKPVAVGVNALNAVRSTARPGAWPESQETSEEAAQSRLQCTHVPHNHTYTRRLITKSSVVLKANDRSNVY